MFQQNDFCHINHDNKRLVCKVLEEVRDKYYRVSILLNGYDHSTYNYQFQISYAAEGELEKMKPIDAIQFVSKWGRKSTSAQITSYDTYEKGFVIHHIDGIFANYVQAYDERGDFIWISQPEMSVDDMYYVNLINSDFYKELKEMKKQIQNLDEMNHRESTAIAVLDEKNLPVSDEWQQEVIDTRRDILNSRLKLIRFF